MSLTRRLPGDNIVAVLQSGISDLQRRNDPLATVLLTGRGGQREALPMYSVNLQDVANGTAGKPRFTGWRFLAATLRGDGIAVDVVEPKGRPPTIGAMQRGTHIAKRIQALQSASDQRDLVPEDQDVELALLSVPGLYIETVWFMPKSGGTGWAVPYHTLIKQLQSSRSYPLEELIQEIVSLAKKRLQSNDGIEGSSAQPEPSSRQ